jgi:uncharacterized membrane protein YdcZ (DUF606 family)
MQISFYLIGWVVLSMVVIALAFYRLSLSHREDDVLHLAASEGGLIPGQTVLAARIKRISRLGASLTLVVVVYGLVLLFQYGYGLWTQGYKPQ